MMKSEEYANKVVLVTGASRGIGYAIAEAFARQGYSLVGTATSHAGVEKITALCERYQINGTGLRMDVGSIQSIEEGMALITQDYGAPTILINNAAVVRDNLLLRMREDEWRTVMQTNLDAIYYLSKAVLKGMAKARWGRIVNISSVVARTGHAGQVNYAAAKAGMEGFTRSLASEMASRGITANAVAPGFIQTDMTQSLSELQREAILNNVPLKRLGQPQEVAAAVMFLASSEAAYITGATIPVNGGLMMG